MCWLATRSPTTDHNWGHQGWFRASNTNGRSRCGKPCEQSVPPATRGPLPCLVAPGVLVHLQAAASVTLLFNALSLHSQNRFPGFPAFQTISIMQKARAALAIWLTQNDLMSFLDTRDRYLWKFWVTLLHTILNLDFGCSRSMTSD